MEVTFYFEDKDYELDEYDYDVGRLEDFINNLEAEDLCDLAKSLFLRLPDKDKQEIIEILETDISEDTFNDTSDPEVIDISEYIVNESEPEDIFDLMSNEIRDFYYEEAKEAYKDAKAYQKNPYSYYGLDESDFF